MNYSPELSDPQQLDGTVRHEGGQEVDHGCREDAPATQTPPHAPRGRANNRPQVLFAHKLVLNQWLLMEGA